MKQSREGGEKSSFLTLRNKTDEANAREEKKVLDFTFVAEQAERPDVFFLHN